MSDELRILTLQFLPVRRNAEKLNCLLVKVCVQIWTLVLNSISVYPTVASHPRLPQKPLEIII